jgi:hypothetical protein
MRASREAPYWALERGPEEATKQIAIFGISA